VTPEEMTTTLSSLTNKRIILVAQTHLSGVKKKWWEVYEAFFNTGTVSWKSLDEFSSHPIILPFSKIPINMEVKYMTPSPKIPLEQELDI
jgi:hypothetical protein